MIRFLAPLLALLCAALPAPAQTPVTVFAAAALRGALDEIAAHYPADVSLSYAGSGTLARQIAAGAPVDVVVLAHPDWLRWLEDRDLILRDTTTEVAGGQLVLIGPADSPPLPAPDAAALLTALQGGRLAMGQRDGVPAGTYARQWLHHIGAWDTLETHLAETDNVRAALALVATGAAPLGVVYASDALAEPRVAIRHNIPPQSHSAIRYPAAALHDTGRAFVRFLTTPAATAIFARHGFTP